MFLRELIFLCLWLIAGGLFVRALLRRDLYNRRIQLIWLMFWLMISSLTLWGSEAEWALDQLFGGHPVAMFFKYVGFILGIYIYNLLQLDALQRKPNRFFKWFGPVMIGVGVIGLVLYILFRPFPTDSLRYLVIAVRDVVMLIYLLLSTGPNAIQLLHQETVAAMRAKLWGVLLIIIAFTLTGASSIMAALMTLFNFGDPLVTSEIFRPVVYPGLLIFVFIFIPYRWIVIAFTLRRLLLYWRLRRLHAVVVGDMPQAIMYGSLHVPRNLDLEIYRTVIAILDHYLVTARPSLQEQIRSCLNHNDNYHDLMREMAKIKP